jgi:spermidine synthase
MNAPLEVRHATEPKQRPYPLPPLPHDRYYVEDADPPAGGEVVFMETSDRFDGYTYQLQNVVYSGQTAIQRVLIADTYNYGRALMLDGAIQSAQDDESLYHELLVQPAMLAHPNPRDVLIIGGGEGATLREVLAHASVLSATMVDIDRELIDLCREHLVSWHRGAFDDPRVRLAMLDGRAFVERDERSYDVIIIDVIDMLEGGPAQLLYTRQFYELLRTRLRPNGLVVVQGLEFTFLDDRAHAALARTLRTVFPEVHSYHAAIPSFLGTWGFLLASDWCRPTDWRAEQIDSTIEQRLGSSWLDHLTGEYLKSRFVHCKETQFLLSLPGPILEDGVPFIAPPSIEDVEVSYPAFPFQFETAR